MSYWSTGKDASATGTDWVILNPRFWITHSIWVPDIGTCNTTNGSFRHIQKSTEDRLLIHLQAINIWYSPYTEHIHDKSKAAGTYWCACKGVSVKNAILEAETDLNGSYWHYKALNRVSFFKHSIKNKRFLIFINVFENPFLETEEKKC